MRVIFYVIRNSPELLRNNLVLGSGAVTQIKHSSNFCGYSWLYRKGQLFTTAKAQVKLQVNNKYKDLSG